MIPRPFAISPGVVVPAGGTTTGTCGCAYSLGSSVSSRAASLRLRSLYDGTRTEASYSGRVAILPQFAVEPSMTLNWVDLPYGSFDATTAQLPIHLHAVAADDLSSLIQYNVSLSSISSSVRLRWEYSPGSELFLVYSDGHNLLDSQTPAGPAQSLDCGEDHPAAALLTDALVPFQPDRVDPPVRGSV